MRTSNAALFRICLLCWTLAVGPAHAGGAMDFLFAEGVPPANERHVDGVQRIWKIGEFSALRLEDSAPGAPANAQPVSLDPQFVLASLASVQFESMPGVWKPLFAPSDLPAISQTLVQALAVAKARDDVLLLASSRDDSAAQGLPHSVLARIFFYQNALHVIVHEARADLLASHRSSNRLPVYDFGVRERASASKISAGNSQQMRADWLAFGPDTPPGREAATTVEEEPMEARLESLSKDAPAEPRGRIFYEQQAQRLEALKALLDKGLISQAEYSKKRTEILHGL